MFDQIQIFGHWAKLLSQFHCRQPEMFKFSFLRSQQQGNYGKICPCRLPYIVKEMLCFTSFMCLLPAIKYYCIHLEKSVHVYEENEGLPVKLRKAHFPDQKCSVTHVYTAKQNSVPWSTLIHTLEYILYTDRPVQHTVEVVYQYCYKWCYYTAYQCQQAVPHYRTFSIFYFYGLFQIY